ncbi:MAG TPA: glycoside hydrolase family 20 zincin-like fold domain-containing protein [Candidatus Dormibacteraeota bacterium]|nr:glycoside hydrolase family 20 zincin-like fold domain-containing protein [Candidatus Dormibacteraeota bacterium]
MLTALVLSALHLLPRPQSVAPSACSSAYAFSRPLRVASGFDPAARDEIDERWQALGLPILAVSENPDVTVVRDPGLPSQGYTLDVAGSSVRIAASDGAGAFYAAMTLAQLATRSANGWSLPCVHIVDRPALRWRILSDDVSRGPLPTMRYFESRIRTIAAFKMNGYSPYMEHVFVSPTDPLPAPLDGITPVQLRELNAYAERFHVALIPEQQTFAHMHNTLKYERYASAAELPHGFLLSPASRLAAAYLRRIVGQELQAVPHPPFFHIGSDETATLGLGTTRAYVASHGGRAQVYAAHIRAMAKLIAPSGARVMLWDDGIEADPSIMKLLPKNAVIVNWHYGNLATYEPFIRTIASGGFQQMVAPGSSNWSEIYADIDTAIANERRFIAQGKSAHVLGLFQTVWHDDGETLYESTWYPVLYAASDAWETSDLAPQRFQADFPAAFFGVDDARYGRDIALLGNALTRLEGSAYDTTDRLFWSDPFDPAVAARMAKVDLHAVRLDAESVETHLLQTTPPLHAGAARAMFLAARRYDVLGRAFQSATEVRAYYADALKHVREPHGPALRDLFWCKYWFWELRDDYESLGTLYTAAWLHESRPGHLASNLERYHMAAQREIERADAIDRVTYESYVRHKTLPPFAKVIHP